MKKSLFVVSVLVLAISLALPLAGIVSASGSEIPDSKMGKLVKMSSDPRYDRNPSFLISKDKTYWLFFARGRNPIGIRGIDGYDPDSDSYDIYYKTAKSIPALQKAKENLIPGSNKVPPFNAQRDIATLQTNDGTIWVFVSSGYGVSTNEHVFYYQYKNGSWSGPTQIEGTDIAGHISVVEYHGKIWLFFDAWDYILKVTSWDGANWSSPVTISEKATLAKAIVDKSTFYLAWSYIDPSANEWGKYIGLFTSSNEGATWNNHGKIAEWPGGTNWDPVLLKDRDGFSLFWAPDAGVNGQFIAASYSRTPTVSGSWSAPRQITRASHKSESWWDFWPQPYVRGTTYLFFTSERSDNCTAKSDANIWMLEHNFEPGDFH
jgi:hypothetical protein